MEKVLKMKLKMRIQTARRYFYRKRKAVGDCFKLNCTLWSISFQTLAFDSHIQNVKNGDWSIKNLDRITKTNSCGTSDFAQNGIRCLSEANICRSPYCHYWHILKLWLYHMIYDPIILLLSFLNSLTCPSSAPKAPRAWRRGRPYWKGEGTG